MHPTCFEWDRHSTFTRKNRRVTFSFSIFSFKGGHTLPPRQVPAFVNWSGHSLGPCNGLMTQVLCSFCFTSWGRWSSESWRRCFSLAVSILLPGLLGEKRARLERPEKDDALQSISKHSDHVEKNLLLRARRKADCIFGMRSIAEKLHLNTFNWQTQAFLESIKGCGTPRISQEHQFRHPV